MFTVKRLTVIIFSCFAALFLALSAPSVSHGMSLSLIGDNFDLSSGLATNRQAPSVAYNSVDNEYLVIWNETTMTTTDADVSGQRVSAVGTLLNENIQVTNFMGYQVSPIVTHNNMDNEYFVVWKSQFDRPGSTDFNDAFGRRVSNNGVLLGDAFRIFDGGLEISTAYNGSNSSFNNQYLVTGRSFASGPAPGILGQMVSNSGSIVGSEIPIATAGAPAPSGQVVYNRNTNEYFSTWRNQVERNLQGQRITASGELLGDPIIISPAFPETGLAASVAFDPSNDRYLVVFGVFQENEILGQFVSSSGELIGSNFIIATGLLSKVHPYIAYSGIDNAFVVVWEEVENIIGQLLSDDGIVIGDKLIVAQGTGQFGSPRLAHNSETGQFLVAWRDVRNVQQGEVDIFAQLIGITFDGLNVVVDIKPGNDRNIINPTARGGIWVAVLSDTDSSSPFDPSSQVDISSVEFGPEGAKAIRYKVKDTNQDGLGDLLLRFKLPHTGIACGDTDATLTGETFDGQSFTGTDSVKTVGCNKAKKSKKKKNKGK